MVFSYFYILRGRILEAEWAQNMLLTVLPGQQQNKYQQSQRDDHDYFSSDESHIGGPVHFIPDALL